MVSNPFPCTWNCTNKDFVLSSSVTFTLDKEPWISGSGCVAQLVERSLPIPEIRGSNPVIGKIYWTFVYCQLCVEKTKIRRKEAGNGPFFKKEPWISTFTGKQTFNVGTRWRKSLTGHCYQREVLIIGTPQHLFVYFCSFQTQISQKNWWLQRDAARSNVDASFGHNITQQNQSLPMPIKTKSPFLSPPVQTAPSVILPGTTSPPATHKHARHISMP